MIPQLFYYCSNTKFHNKSISLLKSILMNLKKQFNEKKLLSNVNFILLNGIASSIISVNYVVDFKNRDINDTLTKKVNNKSYPITIKLEKLKQYPFKYIIDGSKWQYDNIDDKHVPNTFRSKDSIIIL